MTDEPTSPIASTSSGSGDPRSANPPANPLPEPSDPHRLTLMTVHAHPDDETIGTGGVMAKAVADGHRVILVTCTRGEQGEIVVKEMDTPENHRKLGEIRAEELAAAMAELGVTEWENLGYRDSDMMGRPTNEDPRSFWQADLDEAAGRLVWLMRRYQPDVVTTYNAFGGYGHPDHIRVHDVSVRAFERAGDPAWYPKQLEGDTVPWAPKKLYETAIPQSVREKMAQAMKAAGQPSFWEIPDDISPEERAEREAFMAKMLVPDETITTWVDISGDPMDRKWRAIQRHVTQIATDSGFMAMGEDGWKSAWTKEAFVLRESRVETVTPEDDLFVGLG
ncbi:MAG TPA: PIG-L family deacetylase [Candidatus Limnocylindrales bacterium]|nr:PIG-L family deacetylase [Candidatus Limnocylindrales bacterium]